MVLTCFDTFGPSLGHNESHDHRFWLDLICSDHAPYYILQTSTWVWTHPTSGFGEIGPTGDLLLLSDTYVLVFCVFLVVLAILLQILGFGILLDISWWHLDDILMILWQVSTRSQSPPETRANPPVHHGLPAAPAIKACVIKNVITCKEHQGTVRTHVPRAVSNPTTWPHGKWTYLSCRLMIIHILHYFTLEHQKTSKSFSKLLTVEALPFTKPDHLKIQLYVYRLSRTYYPNLLDFEMLCVGYILVCWKLIVFGWWQNSANPNAEHPRAELSIIFGCLFLK